MHRPDTLGKISLFLFRILYFRYAGHSHLICTDYFVELITKRDFIMREYALPKGGLSQGGNFYYFDFGSNSTSFLQTYMSYCFLAL